PPGPGNPLGLRAINWTAPAIRFHGTSALYSLGYNASHGCVRMSNEDVIELYDMIDVGTPIVSVVAGPFRPLYASSPDPVLVEDDAANEGTRRAAAAAEAERDDKPSGKKPSKGDG
ncbi:MAG: L,D-transpeptidase, partial [Actinomycetota bacterium]|nr:L,D-transpeptidase [Actinomycetota bacterium]